MAKKEWTEPKVEEVKEEIVVEETIVAEPEPTPKPAAPKVKNPNEGLTQRFGRGATWWEDADGNVVEVD